MDAGGDYGVVAVNRGAGEEVAEGEGGSVGEDGAGGLGAGDVVGDGEVERGEGLAGLPGGNGQSGREESGERDDGVHFGGGDGAWLVDRVMVGKFYGSEWVFGAVKMWLNAVMVEIMGW